MFKVVSNQLSSMTRRGGNLVLTMLHVFANKQIA